MKLVCIDNRDYLTIGKIYISLPIPTPKEGQYLDLRNHYQIVDDEGQKLLYHKSLFKELNKIREEKIDQILK